MPFFTIGDNAMLNPVIIISTICIAKPSKSKNPLYHDSIIFRGVVPIQSKAAKNVTRVRRMAKTNALGIYFRKSLVNFSPKIFIIESVLCWAENFEKFLSKYTPKPDKVNL